MSANWQLRNAELTAIEISEANHPEDSSFVKSYDTSIYLPAEYSLLQIPLVEGPLRSAEPVRKTKDNSIWKLAGKKELKKGNICLCSEEDINDINRVIKLASDRKVSGIIVAKEPTGPIKIPVVVLDIDTICSLNHKTLTVKVQLIDEKHGVDDLNPSTFLCKYEDFPSNHSDIPEASYISTKRKQITSPDRHSLEYLTEGNSKKSKVYNSDIDQQMIILPQNNEEIEVTLNDDTKSHNLHHHPTALVVENQALVHTESENPAPNNNVFGRISSTVKTVKNFIVSYTKSEVQQKLDKILLSGGNWYEEIDFSSFNAAVGLLLERSSKNEKKLEETRELAETLQRYMLNRKYYVDVLFLEFSATVYQEINYLSGSNNKLVQSFKWAILEGVTNLDTCCFKGYKLCDVAVVNFRQGSSCCMLKNVLVDTLAKWKGGKMSNTLLTNILWVRFYHFDAEKNKAVPPNLSIVAQEDFLETQMPILEIFMEEKLLRSFGLYLQPSLDKFCNRFLQDSPHLISVRAPLHKHLLRLITDSFQKPPVNKTFEYELNILIKVLALIQFDPDDDDIKKTVVLTLVESLDYRNHGTFGLMNALYCSMPIDHRQHRFMQISICKNVCEALIRRRHMYNYDRQSIVKMTEVESLLHPEGIGLLLASREGVMSISSYTSEIMCSFTPFGTKLAFLSNLHNSFVINEWAPDTDDFVSRLQQFVKKALQHEKNGRILCRSLELANKIPSVFADPKGTNRMINWLAQTLTSTENISEVLNDPSYMVGLTINTLDVEPNSLLSCLLSELKVALFRECKRIEQVTTLFTRWCFNRASRCLALVQIGEQVLVNWFWHIWSPSTIADIVTVDPYDLQILYTCLTAEECTLDRNKCIDSLGSLVRCWQDKWAEDEITKSEIASLLNSFSDISWKVLTDVSGKKNIDFPGKELLEGKLAEFASLKSSIHCKFVIDDTAGKSSQSVLSLLRRYNVSTEIASTVSELLKKYSYEPPLSETLIDRTVSLHEMKMDQNHSAAIRNEHDESLQIAAYFLHSPSVLFRDALGFGTWMNLSPEDFFRKVGETKQTLQNIFLDTVLFTTIIEKVQLVVKTGGDVLLESLAVMNCPEFTVTEINRQQFCIVALLIQIKKPLQQFLNCCHQFKFAFVENDPNFLELSEASRNLFSEGALSWSASKCVAITRHIFRLIFPIEADSMVGSDEFLSLRSALPLLQFFGALSLNGDVWSLVGDMKWSGKEGLKRFYQEYENVTNMFLGGSVSYEISVLDSLEPCVRCLSPLSHDEDSMALFLKTVNASIESISLKDFEVVQRNVSSIRDWFTSGLDDIAAIFGTFKRVSFSGEYYVRTSANGSDPGKLCLKYNSGDTAGKGNVPTTSNFIVMEHDALNDFVERLGFIQHESNSFSDKVESFVEQHHAILKSAENFLQMSHVGYSTDKLFSFSFKVSCNTLTEAKDLLSRSNENWQECERWLERIYHQYNLSLLFSTEELREIHNHIIKCDQTVPSEMDLHQVTCAVSRIILTNRNILEGLLHDAVRRLVGSLEKDSSWLETVSKFLDSLNHDICLAGSHSISNFGGKISSSNIVVHSLSCDKVQQKDAVISLMMHIYANRLPKQYEVLDGSYPCSRQKIKLFLERIIHFPSGLFVILNSHNLSGDVQEKILSFLSHQDIVSKRIQLHCIQCKPTLRHASPWVQRRDWDNGSLQKISYTSSNNWLKEAVLDHYHIDSITVVASEKCGTGKTRMIREKLSKLQDENEYQVGAINIHECTTLTALVKALVRKFPLPKNNNSIYFALTCMDTDGFGSTDWTEVVNQFFMSLLVLRNVHDPSSGTSFYLGAGHWDVVIELQMVSTEKQKHSLCPEGWLRQFVPVLYYCGKIERPNMTYFIDSEAYRVCTYLRAYKDGTINRKFEPYFHKRIIFVLDESGSMEVAIGNGKHALDVATDNALRIFDSHIQVNDMIGVVTFSCNPRIQVALQRVEDEQHKLELRNTVNNSRWGNWGGTNMYTAINYALTSIEANNIDDAETWIVCLTDGCSADHSSIVESRLRNSSDKLHIILIGVNLPENLYGPMQALCCKFKTTDQSKNKGFFVPTVSQLDAMNDAFQKVANSIPVSQTFEFDGKLSDQDCRCLMRSYLPDFVDEDDMLLQSFWIKFLYRRVKVFDENEQFNYNVKHESLGSSLMETMLSEVDQFLRQDQIKSWSGKNHHQLIYDFSNISSPEFRLICTSPEEMDRETRQKYESLDLPGFVIPTTQDLAQRSTLDRFISQALNVPLSTRDDGQIRISCIDDHSFVLTLDFTMKILSIHERIACRVPCIIEGETGVSKTALTKMYSILVNARVVAEGKISTEKELEKFELRLTEMGFPCSCGDVTSSYDRLQRFLAEIPEVSMGAEHLFNLITDASNARSCTFQDIPPEFLAVPDISKNLVSQFLKWFSDSLLEQTFFEINVHSSLTEADVLHYFKEIRMIANKLQESQASVVVFLDEVNTSSIIGLFKEIIIDHSICGDLLERNIVIVAACNPARKKVSNNGVSQRENDLGKLWASGHYQVSNLPATVVKLKWAYGSLTVNQEREFVQRRIEMLGNKIIPPAVVLSLTNMISISQETIRSLAAIHMLKVTDQGTVLEQNDAEQRAMSMVSLRDIQRVFILFQFFLNDFNSSLKNSSSLPARYHQAMLLAIAVVYYLRLDTRSRQTFLAKIEELPVGEETDVEGLQEVLDFAMDIVISNTEIPPGIADTRGLRENVFMTLVCSLSQTPLMIIGPPGSSKTLSVNVVSDNANGEESPSLFYRKFARLSFFHYQCSKASTSKEISSVFEKAIQRQRKVNPCNQKCVVFMDEAGLPEENRESMKVLHYFLEGHMSAKAAVGFVAITNHVLDAAKSNRCVTLHREEPDGDELLTIATGVLFESKVGNDRVVRQIECDGVLWNPDHFARGLCRAYTQLLHDEQKFKWFGLFFGLRDFIYFLRAIACSCRRDILMQVSMAQLVHALERNFNGNDSKKLKDVALCLLGFIESSEERILSFFRHPMNVVREAISWDALSSDLTEKCRFKLIIDETDDDSIMRLLCIEGSLDFSKRCLFKLSSMPEGGMLEQSRLISGVKYAALQGSTVVLSQTESVNESFYDLFNQNFRSLKNRDGKISLFANIAVGGISRRSLVQPSFQCIVHVRTSEIDDVPAPFLNRFEKFRLSVSDVFDSGWGRVPGMLKIMRNARAQVADLCSLLGENGIFGWVEMQTLDSIFVDMLPKIGIQDCTIVPSQSNRSFLSCVLDFICHVTSLPANEKELDLFVNSALKYLSLADSALLESLLDSALRIDHQSMNDAFDTIVRGGEDTSLSRIIRIVVQMFVTRAASFRIMMLATPEALFACRNLLPSDIIEEYFRQEHFSLKRLLVELLSVSDCNAVYPSLQVVYTRTDPFVHSLPSLSADCIATQGMNFEIVKKLVCKEVSLVIIEHLLLLKNEASIRSAVDNWAVHPCKRIFLLVVDMNDQHATNRVNFVRSLVEQQTIDLRRKVFVLLLHYPPASSHRKLCYPALFLGGWKHIFLDEVGKDYDGVAAERWIEAACTSASDCKKLVIRPNISSLMKSALIYTASQNVFYAGQVGSTGLFSERLDLLSRVMNKTIGGNSISEIIANMFLQVWTERALNATLKRASDALITGTTQLSMCSSLRSMFQETLNSLFASVFIEMNQWRNVDILFNCNCCRNTDSLFGQILRTLPIMPLDELNLYRNMQGRLQPIPAYISANCSSSVSFPFFSFVSSFLDKVVEMAESATQMEMDAHGITFSVINCAMNLLQNHNVGSQREAAHLAQYRKVVAEVLDTIKKIGNIGTNSLYHRYVSQYVQWKLGCTSESMIIPWMLYKVSEFGECAHSNILIFHVVYKKHELEVIRLASWTEFSQKHCSIDCSLSPSSDSRNILECGGTELLQKFIKQFEMSLRGLLTNSSSWSADFSAFSSRVTDIIGGEMISNHVIASLRVLTFYHVLGLTAPPDVLEKAIQYFYDEKKHKLKSNARETASLDELFSVIHQPTGREAELWVHRCTELILRRFFSLRWLHAFMNWTSADFSFLLKLAANEKLLDQQVFTVLLRNVVRTMGFHNSQFCLTEISGISGAFFQIFSANVDCASLQFCNQSGRAHFVPAWIIDQSGLCCMHQSHYEEVDAFFSNYKQVECCSLTSAMFDVMVSILLREGVDASSEKILLELINDFKTEFIMKNSDADTTGMAFETISAIGCITFAMTADARLFCYVAKVAYELAVNSRAAALSGQYAELGHYILQSVMFLEGYRWQDFFFYNIIRVRGIGTLLTLLGEGGALHSMPWCQSWVLGTPSSKCGSEQALKNAEDAFAEAARDEERKRLDLRLCPQCRGPFSILQMNCGNFVCGRDAHQNIGNELIGCGFNFNVSQALRYVIDETLLSPLRKTVEEERSRLNECLNAAMLLEKAEQMEVPVLLHVIEKDPSQELFVPASVMLDAMESFSKDPVSNSAAILIKALLDERNNVERYSFLPDFIELYVWIHSVFRFLVTKEQAIKKKMSEVMKDHILSRRFDAVSSSHIARLWKRTTQGFNSILNSGHSIFWDCEEVNIPFQKLEDASLMMLLSEGDHPTDGHDYLFLLINDIACTSNAFSGRLHEIHKIEHTTAIMPEVHPKFVIPGSNAAVAITSLSFYSIHDLASLIQSVWCEKRGIYELDRLSFNVSEELFGFLANRPAILNPSSFLREKFQFRDDNVPRVSRVESTHSSYIGTTGDYFVHIQDLQLFEDVRCSLKKLELANPSSLNSDLTRIFSVNFYQMDYDGLRSILEGLRTTIGLFSVSSVKLCKTYEDAILKFVQGPLTEYTLSSFGFPLMKDMQLKLIMSLKLIQLFEFITFLGYQLASEAYLYSNFPLCMTDPLSPSLSERVLHNFTRFCSEMMNLEEAVRSLDDFVNSVLSFYEAQICEASTSNNKSLRFFLINSNFCDETTFPFFTIIPEAVTIHNYVPLRQLLHQMKLAALHRKAAVDVAEKYVEEKSLNCSNRDSSFAKPSRGRCWMWVEISVEEECERAIVASDDCNLEEDEFWFDVSSKKRQFIADTDVDVLDALPDALKKEPGGTFRTPMHKGLRNRAYSW